MSKVYDNLVAQTEDINRQLNDNSIGIEKVGGNLYEVELFDDEGNNLSLIKTGTSHPISVFLEGMLFGICEAT